MERAATRDTWTAIHQHVQQSYPEMLGASDVASDTAVADLAHTHDLTPSEVREQIAFALGPKPKGRMDPAAE